MSFVVVLVLEAVGVLVILVYLFRFGFRNLHFWLIYEHIKCVRTSIRAVVASNKRWQIVSYLRQSS